MKVIKNLLIAAIAIAIVAFVAHHFKNKEITKSAGEVQLPAKSPVVEKKSAVGHAASQKLNTANRLPDKKPPLKPVVVVDVHETNNINLVGTNNKIQPKKPESAPKQDIKPGNIQNITPKCLLKNGQKFGVGSVYKGMFGIGSFCNGNKGINKSVGTTITLDCRDGMFNAPIAGTNITYSSPICGSGSGNRTAPNPTVTCQADGTWSKVTNDCSACNDEKLTH